MAPPLIPVRVRVSQVLRWCSFDWPSRVCGVGRKGWTLGPWFSRRLIVMWEKR